MKVQKLEKSGDNMGQQKLKLAAIILLLRLTVIMSRLFETDSVNVMAYIMSWTGGLLPNKLISMQHLHSGWHTKFHPQKKFYMCYDPNIPTTRCDRKAF